MLFHVYTKTANLETDSTDAQAVEPAHVKPACIKAQHRVYGIQWPRAALITVIVNSSNGPCTFDIINPTNTQVFTDSGRSST